MLKKQACKVVRSDKVTISNEARNFYWYRLHDISYEYSLLDLLANSAPKRRILEIGRPINPGAATHHDAPDPLAIKDFVTLDAEMVQHNHLVLLRDRQEHLTLGSLSEFEANLWKKWLSEHGSWPVAMFLEKSQSDSRQIRPYACFTRRARKWPVSDDDVEVDLKQDLEAFGDRFRKFISLEQELDGFMQRLRTYLNNVTGTMADKDVVGWSISQAGVESYDLNIFATLAEEVVMMYKAARRMKAQVQEFHTISCLLLTTLNFLEHISLYLQAVEPSDLWGVLDWSYDPGTLYDSATVLGEAVSDAFAAGWAMAYLGI